MHSPEVLAFSIWRPWPTIHKQPMGRNNPKWSGPIRRRDDGSHYISRFSYVNGTELYFPSLIDVWHMEPGGADSLTICKNRVTDSQGKFVRWSHAWKWHFWHYRITSPALYEIRRYLFTRCAECGGPSRKGNMVNHSDSWNRTTVPLWCGEVGLYHSECLSRKSKRHHEHDPRGCYACSGKAAFEFGKTSKPNILPLIVDRMPAKQRRILSGLHTMVQLGLMPYETAVANYNKAKAQATWQ